VRRAAWNQGRRRTRRAREEPVGLGAHQHAVRTDHRHADVEKGAALVRQTQQAALRLVVLIEEVDLGPQPRRESSVASWAR